MVSLVLTVYHVVLYLRGNIFLIVFFYMPSSLTIRPETGKMAGGRNTKMTMRYFELTADRETVVTPLERIVPPSEAGSKYHLISAQLKEDDRWLLVYQFNQLPTDIERYLQDHNKVLRYNIRHSEQGETILSIYLHFEQRSVIADIMRLSSVFLDLPLEYDPSENTKVKIFGPSSELRTVCESIISKYQLSITKAGDYSAESNLLSDQVTNRQKEILRAAFREGYYSVPRETTLVELSDQLGNAPPTIQGIIRRSEYSIFRHLASANNQDSVTDNNAKNHP
jgi:hypothetical protein